MKVDDNPDLDLCWMVNRGGACELPCSGVGGYAMVIDLYLGDHVSHHAGGDVMMSYLCVLDGACDADRLLPSLKPSC